MTDGIGQPLEHMEPETGGTNGASSAAGTPSGGFSAARLNRDRYYDLTAAGVDAQGFVPWPSHERRQRFYEDLDVVLNELRDKRAERRESGDTDEASAEIDETNAENVMERRDLFATVFGEDKEQHERFVEIAARFCNGSPTKSQLKKLPPDVFVNGVDGFFDWLLQISLPKRIGQPGTL